MGVSDMVKPPMKKEMITQLASLTSTMDDLDARIKELIARTRRRRRAAASEQPVGQVAQQDASKESRQVGQRIDGRGRELRAGATEDQRR